MKIEIPKPKTDTRVLVYNPLTEIAPHKNMQIMRIELDDDFTRIDFAYKAPRRYENGGWVRIERTCFIRPTFADIRLRMIRAVNIPIAPRQHEFRACGEYLYYTLYFPPLPKSTKAIDIIERETSDPSYLAIRNMF